MMKASNIYDLFQSAIEDYHRYDSIDQPLENPHRPDSLEGLLYHKNWVDTVQWHLEDEIRAPFIEPTEALILKRRIDTSNQKRTDLVEQIDELILEHYQGVQARSEARLNTESPAWAIDRLSILALKVYHMSIEAERDHAQAEKQKEAQNKLAILHIQRDDLILAIDQLLEDLAGGLRLTKVYRQMKMYNDPELNPALYQKKS